VQLNLQEQQNQLDFCQSTASVALFRKMPTRFNIVLPSPEKFSEQINIKLVANIFFGGNSMLQRLLQKIFNVIEHSIAMNQKNLGVNQY